MSEAREQTDAPARLELRGISKRYPGVLANDSVDLTLQPGEIHALLGENGAGKSTLVQIVYGVVKADAGEIRWNGETVSVDGPSAARALGIGMVFQHFSLFETLTVTENVALGLSPRVTAKSAGGMAALAARIADVSKRYGLALDPDARVFDLSVGERQRVEIVRCLLQDPTLLIMDEPTSVLTPQEADQLFETLRRLASEGRTILYISHKLDEIRRLCGAATILRGGKVVASCDPRQETAQTLARLMIGEEVSPTRRAEAGEAEEKEALLRVEGLSMKAANPLGTPLHDVRLSVRRGEILGIAGVAGNGQNTLLGALSGEQLAPRADAVVFEGAAIGLEGARARRDRGINFVPEDRLGHGAVADLSLSDNALLSGWRRWSLVRRGLVSFTGSREKAEHVVKTFAVAAPGAHAAARSLSGGNLQKFIIGREILQKPKLLIAAHPTWGVDAGAAAAIHQALIELASNGAGVIVVSQDLDELFTLSDRVAVICAGRLSESRPAHEVTAEEVGLMMGGLFDAAIAEGGGAPSESGDVRHGG
ncbi:MAG: ABC transporter ATP-binding protein [Marivibrio sp.]|uniref:ABC transporter ATP-binding protein n=1 Tax=Marivibrio sp. TaxID=2039719 RepID=UPI0032ED27BA